jgi:hypothetical protein
MSDKCLIQMCPPDLLTHPRSPATKSHQVWKRCYQRIKARAGAVATGPRALRTSFYFFVSSFSWLFHSPAIGLYMSLPTCQAQKRANVYLSRK